MSDVKEVGVPQDGLLRACLPRIDFADAFAVAISENRASSVDDLARAAFARMPDWVMALLRLRNAMVAPLGLKVSYDPATESRAGELSPGASVGFFQVYARAQDEVLLGEDGHHLNFRVSVRREGPPGARRAIITTVVQFNNWLGRLYFIPVRPFHRLIVPAILKRSLHD